MNFTNFALFPITEFLDFLYLKFYELSLIKEKMGNEASLLLNIMKIGKKRFYAQ